MLAAKSSSSSNTGSSGGGKTMGLTEADMAAAAAAAAVPPEGEDGESEHECPVCKDAFEEGAELRRMPCRHLFHTDCLLTWLKQVRVGVCVCILSSTLDGLID